MVRVERAYLAGRDAVGSEKSRLTEKSIPALLTRPLQASLEHFVVGPLSGGSRRFTSAKKIEGGGKI